MKVFSSSPRSFERYMKCSKDGNLEQERPQISTYIL